MTDPAILRRNLNQLLTIKGEVEKLVELVESHEVTPKIGFEEAFERGLKTIGALVSRSLGRSFDEEVVIELQKEAGSAAHLVQVLESIESPRAFVARMRLSSAEERLKRILG